MDHAGMSFFPAGFDARADVVGLLQLVKINTPDGDFRFMLGVDGRFVDMNGDDWWGSVLADSPDIQMSINGVAPTGQITLAWFADPTQLGVEATLIDEIKALGAGYVYGRPMTFYVQPLTDTAQFWAPVLPPIPFATVEMRSIAFGMSGAAERSISLSWEGAFANRNAARGYYYTTSDHARLTGASNPSLTYAPMDGRQVERLF
jgi:hypothetical protein